MASLTLGRCLTVVTKISRALGHRYVCRPGSTLRPCRSCAGRRRADRRSVRRTNRSPWNRAGVPCGSISVRTETDAVVLLFRSQHPGETEWKSTEQRVPILWTACHLGGRRPWFRCPVYSNGQYCGRRVAVLYAAGDLFACRHCYGLGYASQQESPQSRFIRRSQNIRMRLGGSPDLLQPFPKRPRGMHQRTYMRLRARDLLLLKASIGALHKRLSR